MQALLDFGFLGMLALFLGTIGVLPFLFPRFVSRERWYWLPLVYGALNGILSLVLYLAALAGLFGGPAYFLFALLVLAYFRVIPYRAIPLALLIEIISMLAVFYGIYLAVF